MFDSDAKLFRKVDDKPAAFKMDIIAEDYRHLMADDLDEISRSEVLYKILKNQLRVHQKHLIELKEKKKEEAELRRLQKKPKRQFSELTPVDLTKFARHIKHFELYGVQRDLSPELKRIVRNLSCKEHKFMYCPCCKTYEDMDFDPVENIKKFMAYIKKEQAKLRRRRKNSP